VHSRAGYTIHVRPSSLPLVLGMECGRLAMEKVNEAGESRTGRNV
jgi:hypothetical protein